MQGQGARAAEDFAEALRLDPAMALAKFNLSVAKGEEPDAAVVDAVAEMEPMNGHFAKDLEKFKK